MSLLWLQETQWFYSVKYQTCVHWPYYVGTVPFPLHIGDHTSCIESNNIIKFAGGPSFHFELFTSHTAGKHTRGQQYWTHFASRRSTTEVNCPEFLIKQMSAVLELKEDGGRHLKVGKGMPSEGALLCEGCVDGVWWLKQKMVKTDDMWPPAVFTKSPDLLLSLSTFP